MNGLAWVRSFRGFVVCASWVAFAAPAVGAGFSQSTPARSGRPSVGLPAGFVQEGQCQPSWVPTFGGLPRPVEVLTLAVFDDGSGHGEELYVGGQKWDGATWRPCGDFIADESDGNVFAMLAFDDGSGPGLIAGGQFTSADGQPAANLARWNGTSWSELGGGVNGRVNALAAFDDGSGPALYVAGGFSLAGGVVPVGGIARWDGASWSSVGPVVPAPVISVLTTFDDGSGSGPALYAGGLFTSIGGVPANNVARWDGTSWSALGSGTSGVAPSVLSLTGFDDGLGGGPALYAGGAFTSAGGVSANFVARWDGTG